MTGRRDTLHLACAVVGDYLPHAAAMVASVLESGGMKNLTVHLLHDESVPRVERDAFERGLADAGAALRSFQIPDSSLDGVPTAGFTGKGSWYRVFLPELLPEVDRVLYLDVDLLVLDSLAPLLEVDVSHAYVAAVTNVFEPRHRDRPAALGLRGPDDYFNAGVLVMNLDAMRRNDSTAALLGYARQNAGRLYWRDQDALNVVLGENRVHLHPRWNCMNSIMEFPQAADVFGADQVAEARRAPAIRHFEGPLLNKPWHYLADRSVQRLYRRHRRATPWPHVTLEDHTAATRLLRPLPTAARRRAYVNLVRLRSRRRAGAAGRMR